MGDIVVVPKMKGVAGYNQPDTQSGCPKARKANSNLIAKTITLTQTSIVKVFGHMIRDYNGRADLYLYRGNARLDLSLSYTSGKQWADVQLHHVGRLGKGKYTFSLRSNRANAFGCGTSWGDLDILVLPETVAASKPPTKGDKTLSGGNSGSAKNLKACTGECDADSQCAKGLKCFQRSKGEKIPGCKGNGGGKDWDYCYNPLHGGVKNLSGGNSGSAKNLQRCTGECDADSQCAYGLKCFQRSKGEPIPGCKGNGGGKDWDYCYDPKIEVKKAKKVVAYQVPDKRSGCPGKLAANKALVSKKVTVSEASYVVATGHMIRRYSGRADIHLRLNNKIVDYSLTYTKTTQWQDASVYWVGSINKGSHTFSVTGNRANAFGCGSNWGDLDIIVIPKLKGVAVYQFGVTQSGCPASNLNFKKTITLAQDSIVWAAGHIISKQSGRRADLYLNVDNKRRDNALSYDMTNQWIDQNVNNAMTLKKGKHTFQLTGNSGSKFGCGTGWGDLDIVVVPKLKGVAAYNQPDTKSGCPANRKANSNLIAKTITLTQASIVKVLGHMIRNYNGRADLYHYRGKTRLDLSLSYTAGK